jgi:hypothetical protein
METLDGLDRQIKPGTMAADLASIEIGRVYPLTGLVHVEGTESRGADCAPDSESPARLGVLGRNEKKAAGAKTRNSASTLGLARRAPFADSYQASRYV